MKYKVDDQGENPTDLSPELEGERKGDAISDYLELVAKKLIANGWTITTVESCTGGGLSAALTSIAGSSAYINQAFVTYSNEAKQSLVGVSAQTLVEHGAVSEQTVIEMATGGLTVANANLSVAISGIAGPGGGTEDKPVGTVCFAFAINRDQALNKIEMVTYKKRFSGNREEVRDSAICFVLKQLVTDIFI